MLPHFVECIFGSIDMATTSNQPSLIL